MNTKVYIDPACNILYASFYIKGLRKLYGYKISFLVVNLLRDYIMTMKIFF